VKARLARLRDEGVLQGIHAAPRPALLGLREGLLVFDHVEDAAEREEELLRGLPEVPGVLHADVGHETVHAHVLFRDDADWERIERAAISLTGKPPSHRAQQPAADAAPLAPAAWRVVEALLADGRMPLGDLARASGLSPKTARRRLEGLLARGDLAIAPVLSPAEARGLVLTHVVVERQPSEPLALPEGAFALAPDAALVSVLAPRASLRESLADLRALRASPGVHRVFPVLGVRRSAEAWLREAVAAKLRAAPLVGEKGFPASPPTVRR
jgi:DNA-binding Lrp family transcriptional regulator